MVILLACFCWQGEKAKPWPLGAADHRGGATHRKELGSQQPHSAPSWRDEAKALGLPTRGGGFTVETPASLNPCPIFCVLNTLKKMQMKITCPLTSVSVARDMANCVTGGKSRQPFQFKVPGGKAGI